MKRIDLMKVIESPVVSEKSTLSAEKSNCVVFRVKKTASKLVIKRSVELMFGVEVADVNVVVVKGKRKRFGRFMGTQQDWKKAYVKLRPGFDIDFAVA